jgi:hypothetical protein
MPLPAIPDALWPQILDAVGGDEAARPLLLGLGSSTPRLRALVKRLLSFRLQVAAPEVSACRTCFPEISMLRVVMVPGDVVGLSALNGIRSLHLDGAGRLRASSDHPSLSVTSLALSGSSVDLESLRHMPLLEVLSIDGLASGSSLSPLGALTRLRLLYAHNMDRVGSRLECHCELAGRSVLLAAARGLPQVASGTRPDETVAASTCQ